jgi:hypothetical protein
VHDYTRYLFFLQLKEDLAIGRFVCPERDALQLAAFAVQAEMGAFGSHGVVMSCR